MFSLVENFMNGDPDRNSAEAIEFLGIPNNDATAIAAVHALHVLLSSETGHKSHTATLDTTTSAYPFRTYAKFAEDFFGGQKHDASALRVALILGEHTEILQILLNDDQGEYTALRAALNEKPFHDGQVVDRAAALYRELMAAMSAKIAPVTKEAQFLGYANLLAELEGREKVRMNVPEKIELDDKIEPFKTIYPGNSAIGRELHGIFTRIEETAQYFRDKGPQPPV